MSSAVIARRPVVVCLSAGVGPPRQWRPLAERLAGAYRVLTPALHGHEGGPALPRNRTLTLDDEARAIEDAIAATGVPAHLVGHSYGAAVALKVALRSPSRALSLTLYEPVLFGLLREREADHGAVVECSFLRSGVRHAARSGRPDSIAQVFVDYWAGRGTWWRLPAARREAFLARIDLLDAKFDAVFADSGSLAQYRTLDVPTLVLGGAASPLPVRRLASLLAMTLPRAMHLRLEGMGHLGPVSHAHTVNELIHTHLDERLPRTAVRAELEAA